MYMVEAKVGKTEGGYKWQAPKRVVVWWNKGR